MWSCLHPSEAGPEWVHIKIPLDTETPRLCSTLQASNCEGLLTPGGRERRRVIAAAKPARPGKTVVILKNGKAAATTHDLLFTFGTGSRERFCVLMSFFS